MDWYNIRAMRRFLFIIFLCVITNGIYAEIKPQSIGTYKTEYIGGMSDIFVRMKYSTSGDYYALILREVNIDTYFNVELGKSPQEAKSSIEALLNILNTGSNGEVFIIDDENSVKKQSKNMMNIYNKYLSDHGYIQRRHLNNALAFINMCIPQ